MKRLPSSLLSPLLLASFRFPIQRFLAAGMIFFVSACAPKGVPGPQAHQSHALALQNEGKFEEAKAAWEEVIRKDPKDSVAYYDLALIYDTQGDQAKARELYLKTLELNPKNSDAHTNIALNFLATQELDAGLEHARQATQIAPEFPHYWYNLGLIHHHRHEFDEAIKDYHRAIEGNPKFSLAWYNIGKIHSLESELLEATSDYQKAIAIQADFWEANYNLARLYHRMGDYEQALKYYERALALKPNHSDTEANLQTVKTALNLRKETILQIGGKATTSIEKAWLFHQSGLLKDAEDFYQKAARENPKDIRAAGNLAHVYFLQTRFQDAIRAYNDALSKDPQNGALKQGLAASALSLKSQLQAPIS